MMKNWLIANKLLVARALTQIYTVIMFCTNPSKEYILDLMFIPVCIIVTKIVHYIVEKRYKTV